MNDDVTIAAEPSDEEIRAMLKECLARDGLLELAESVGMRALTDADRLVVLAYNLGDLADELAHLMHFFADNEQVETTMHAIDTCRRHALATADWLSRKKGDTP